MPASVLKKFVGQFTGYRISGELVCPYCGSSNLIARGFAGCNRRHDCIDCRSTIHVD